MKRAAGKESAAGKPQQARMRRKGEREWEKGCGKTAAGWDEGEEKKERRREK